MLEQEIEQLEMSMQDAKNNIKLLDAMERLQKNRDFKLLVESEYFEKEAARAVGMKSSPNFQEDREQKLVDNVIIGIGQLQQFFNKIFQVGMMSKRSLEEYEDEHQRLLAEGADDE